jgi:hypothetical protein
MEETSSRSGPGPEDVKCTLYWCMCSMQRLTIQPVICKCSHQLFFYEEHRKVKSNNIQSDKGLPSFLPFLEFLFAYPEEIQYLNFFLMYSVIRTPKWNVQCNHRISA